MFARSMSCFPCFPSKPNVVPTNSKVGPTLLTGAASAEVKLEKGPEANTSVLQEVKVFSHPSELVSDAPEGDDFFKAEVFAQQYEDALNASNDDRVAAWLSLWALEEEDVQFEDPTGDIKAMMTEKFPAIKIAFKTHTVKVSADESTVSFIIDCNLIGTGAKFQVIDVIRLNKDKKIQKTEKYWHPGVFGQGEKGDQYAKTEAAVQAYCDALSDALNSFKDDAAVALLATWALEADGISYEDSAGGPNHGICYQSKGRTTMDDIKAFVSRNLKAFENIKVSVDMMNISADEERVAVVLDFHISAPDGPHLKIIDTLMLK